MTTLHLKFFFVSLVAIAVLAGTPAYAHCDTMSGPVVRAARRALDTGDVSQALRWVRPQDEAEVQQAFTEARMAASRPTAKESAERRFFETVVRLHRAGEGEPYTGLKEAAPDPSLVAADKAIDTGDVSPLTQGAAPARADGIRGRFARVLQASRHADESLVAGREYVRAYVDYIHFIEADEGEHGHAGPEHAASPHTPEGDSGEAKVVIDQFTAAKNRLKRKEAAKLSLAFRSEPAGARIAWRVECSGIAITGWDAPQMLSILERNGQSGIRAIEARDYMVSDRPVVIHVRRPKTPDVGGEGRCTVRSGNDQKTVAFELR